MDLERSGPETSAELRRVTGERVLRVLRGGNVMSTTQIMTGTGLSRSAVHIVCGELTRRGWVREVERSSAPDASAKKSRGRPSRYFEFAADAGAIVSVDLGVNTIRARVTDLRGRLAASVARHLEDPAEVDRIRVLDEAVDEALAAAGVDSGNVLVASVGVPASLSSNVEVFYPAYQRVADTAQRWAASRSWPLLIENDANLAALGEHRSGAAQHVRNVVVLLAGERLGAGIILDGHLLRGEHASAGELRLLSALSDTIPESTGGAWHARFLAEQAMSEGWATTGLRAAFDPASGEVSAPEIFRAAEAEDPSALEVVRAVCERLARIISLLATLLDPAIVVISGGIADAGEMLSRMTQELLPTALVDNPPPIVVSPLAGDAVVVGGIDLALDYLNAHLLESTRTAQS